MTDWQKEIADLHTEENEQVDRIVEWVTGLGLIALLYFVVQWQPRG